MPDNETTYKRPESVLVVIYNTAGEVLLLERTVPPDFWQSVTGSLRENESPLEAAKREVLEETGVHADKIHDHQQQNRFSILPAWRARYAPDVSENLEHVFSLCVAADTRIHINPREHTACQWLPFFKAAEKVASYTNRDAILAIANREGLTHE